MPDSQLNTIVQTLRAEERQLLEKQRSAAASLKGAEADLQRVRTAIKALGAKPAGKSASAKRPAATKSDVIAIIRDELEANHSVDEEGLKKAVETSIVDAGKSKLGLALRFRQALRDPCFKETSEGYQVAESDQPESTDE